MTLRLARLWLPLVLLAVIPAVGADPVPAAKPAAGLKAGDVMVDSFKLAEGDIDSVLSALEMHTGRTVVRPGQLPTANYSLKITRPIPRSELVTALETLLELNGVSVTPMGDRFLKVTNLGTAKNEAPEMILGSTLDLPASGKIATKIFELTFLRVSEFVPQVQTFMTPGIGGGIVQLEKANVAMVTDTVENLQRIERLLDQVDKPRQASLAPRFYALKNGAKASDVVTKIRSMLTGAAANQLRATTTYTPDDRTNQIIVIADPREYPLFDSIIEQLDIKSDPFTRMEVISLKHGDAKDVASLLSNLVSGQNAASQKTSNQSVRPGQIVAPVAPGAPAPAIQAAAAAAQEGVGSSEFSGLVTIQPDERTNSIVVSGTVDDIRLIRGIVDKIDVLLAQVSIEVVIAEVTLTDSDQNGLQALGLQVGKAPNGGTSITGFSGAIAGWTVGASPGATGLTGVNPLSFLAQLQSAGDRHRVKILQANTITTTHNKKAKFTVSEQKPVITGSTSTPLAASTSISFASSSQVTYKDIGVTLEVTPLIGDDGNIQLNIDQTVDDDQGSTTIDGNSQPIIGHREATAFINVTDGQLAVLGGLQSATHSTDRQKLGLLFEIPIISNILGYRNNAADRTELLLFIRPHVIRQDEATGEANKRIEAMSNKEQIKDYLKDGSRVPNSKDSLIEKLKN